MLDRSSSAQQTEQSSKQRFNGSRVLVAIAVGAAVGALLAYFLKVLIDNTPAEIDIRRICLLYTSPSPRDATLSRMPSSA